MSQCPSCGGDCGYGPLRHCQQGTNHETDFRNNVCTSDEWLANATQSTRDLANKIKSDTVTSASVIAGFEMALSQAEAMIERQQHVMQRAMEAWDTTTHKKNGDGRLWQCMEELRSESGNAIYPA